MEHPFTEGPGQRYWGVSKPGESTEDGRRANGMSDIVRPPDLGDSLQGLAEHG